MSLESALSYHQNVTSGLTAVPPPASPTPDPTPPSPAAPAAPIPAAASAPDPAFERLARKESDLQALREQNKKDREANEAEKARILAAVDKLKQYEALEKYKKVEELRGTDIVGAMRAAGFTEQEIATYYQEISKQLPPEEIARKTAQEVIDKENKVRAEAKAAEDKKIQDQALAQFRKQIDSHMAAEPDKLEYCNWYGDAAKQLIEDTVAACLEKDGEIIPVSEAAELVEQFYEEQDQKMSTLKKRAPKTQTATAPDKPQVAPKPAAADSAVKITTAPDARSKPVTMTNRLTPTVTQAAAPKNETSEDKKARLIAKYLAPQR